MLRTIEEFQRESFVASEKTNSDHPDSSAAEQKKFLLHLKNLLCVVEEGRAVNLYKEIGPELVTLDTGEVMDPVIVNSLKEVSNSGKTMFNDFVRERIEGATKPLSDVIPRGQTYTFNI